MPLNPGTRLGPYEVTAAIGAGGMGEVFRARDTKLDRDVAIKVLPAEVAQDRERLARFEREAKILASLNHPNIAHVYGFEAATLADGSSVHFLAMEMVEGEDLAQRLRQGAVPVDEAVAIARQIAEGLEEAHEHGIIHRDLKPANVKVTPDGKVKILDFGLAKALEGDPATSATHSQLAQSPTISRHMTEAGMIMGTAAYMSPEQARGKPVDKRADIWAFGVVLFEMLTGKRLFSGETVSDVLASVLTRDPDFASLPAATPRSVRQLLERCLARDPRQRLRDMGDARLDLERTDPGASSGIPREAAGPRTRRSPIAAVAALSLVTIVAGGVGYFANNRGGAVPSPAHLAIQLAANQQLSAGGNPVMAFSPDGGTLVFPGRHDGRSILLRRRIDERAAVPIPGTEGGSNPAFSPDGNWLTFTSDDGLRKVATAGGRPFPVAYVQGAGGSCWLDESTIIFTPLYSDGLFRVSANGGSPERLTTPDHAAGELGHWWSEPLPGGRFILFTAFKTPVDQSRVGVLDMRTRSVRWLVEGGYFGRYSPSGHLLYVKGARLYAAPLDAANGALSGPPVSILDDITGSQTGGSAGFAVSSRGTLAYVTESLGNPPGQLVWIDRTGRQTEAAPELRRYISVNLSPDDQRAALTIQGESQNLWILSLDRGTLERLTSGDITEYGAEWSRDGKELFYVRDSPPYELRRIMAGVPDSGKPLWEEPPRYDTFGPALSPDRKTIAFARSEPETGNNLYSRPIDGSAPPRPIRATRANEESVSFSPDGRYVVYQSSETGRLEVYAESFPEPGERAMVSTDGGTEPLWAPNGDIFYRHDDELRVVAPIGGGGLRFGPSRTLARAAPPYSNNSDQRRTYAVSRDGARVLAIVVPEARQARQIEVITDWTTRLASLAPEGRN